MYSTSEHQLSITNNIIFCGFSYCPKPLLSSFISISFLYYDYIFVFLILFLHALFSLCFSLIYYAFIFVS